MNDEEKCRLQNYCGRFYDSDGNARCWCYSTERSRRRVEQLLGECQRLEYYIDALESRCTRDQLSDARKEAQPIRADHSGEINEMMQKGKEAQP